MRNKRLIGFFLTAGKLKSTPRTGWLRHGIREVESVADHSWRTAIIAFVLARRLKFDADKAVKIALFHDLAESKTGDIPKREIGALKKHRLESSAMKAILANLEPKTADEIYDLWSEYLACKTRESALVHDVDKLDTILQALEYEKSQTITLGEFFENKFILPETKALSKEIKARRSR